MNEVPTKANWHYQRWVTVTVVEPDAVRAMRLADAYAAFRDALTEKGWI